MPRSKLIKDTTREERIRIVAEGLDHCIFYGDLMFAGFVTE